MKDLVLIEGLHVDAVIGVYDWEKEILQNLVFDLEMAHDNRPAAATDDLSKTLDYEAISNFIKQYCLENTFELIETLAERLCAKLMDVFEFESILMTLRKPGAVSAARSVGVKIYRTR
ncbi:dihydroneopterin aldolase [Marinomonas mediterranea]|jgi:dihydroneopterin aldolase|uniref:7,8-dihydroneopterin aldolase n=1 Tax=Marinomonas mediterranea (strain ATCC 700492 / JCM 21426 / NBRC 103028 / MMB-1) TaxID=717774 RepID=F2K4I9_MARM1|nr:dihydroneopterin aldolase [Marinomonas mediterranea]ADZ90288.1 dihydroneopterin aldolase [Marinomonas mediterranea MMB-1]WCN12405.1 dihydroneopterin aldolase [Marinomonas mediterranea]WCN16478.1 dihydroneopterin aldolase [Marinomonas mediterranea MMB-1]